MDDKEKMIDDIVAMLDNTWLIEQLSTTIKELSHYAYRVAALVFL